MTRKKTNARTTTKAKGYEGIPCVRHTLSFPEDLWDSLKTEAVSRGLSPNALLRDILSGRYRSLPKLQMRSSG